MTTRQALETQKTASGDLIWQRFSVPYEFPVAFSEGLFTPENPLLADTLALREADKRHRRLVFVDGGVLEARPAGR